MAYTSPATWTGGQLVSATDLNTQLRDNMLFLAGTTGVLPSPHATSFTIDSGGLTVTAGAVTVVAGSITAGTSLSSTTGDITANRGGSGFVFLGTNTHYIDFDDKGRKVHDVVKGCADVVGTVYLDIQPGAPAPRPSRRR